MTGPPHSAATGVTLRLRTRGEAMGDNVVIFGNSGLRSIGEQRVCLYLASKASRSVE